MDKAGFDFLRNFLKSKSGLVLSDDKGYLVDSRLMPLARKRGLDTLDELIAQLRTNNDDVLGIEVTEAMTTNESLFFRDIKPFETLRDVVLPRILEMREGSMNKLIRIWSAACSSGQEPYSIAITLTEMADQLSGFRTELLATDLSSEIITKAKSGLYTQFEAQRGLPIQLLMKYFSQVGEYWQLQESIRNMVKFEQANLLSDLSGLGRFDIVFLRNVLIYFDTEAKTDILTRISTMMNDGGVLYLGGAESVIGICEVFKPLPGQRGVYIVDPDADSNALPGTPASRAAGSVPLSGVA